MIQQKYAPSKPQSRCANNAAASAFRTREQNTQRGTSSSPGAWTLISKQPNEPRKMLKIYFPRVYWHLPGPVWGNTENVISEGILWNSNPQIWRFSQYKMISYHKDLFYKKCLTLCNSVAENRYKCLLQLGLLTEGPGMPRWRRMNADTEKETVC